LMLLDVRSEPAQLGSDTGLAFVNIGNQPHPPRLAWQMYPYWSEMEKKASLAISQGEMA